MAKEPEKKEVQVQRAKPPVEPAYHPLAELRQEVDRLFDSFFGDWPRWPFGRGRTAIEPTRDWSGFGRLVPSVDVSETDKGFEIAAELPGMDEKDIEIALGEGVLTIKGEKREETEKKEKDYYRSERRYGSFRRSFALPEGVDQDKISADFKKGVLTIALPKSPAAQKASRKVKIKSS